MNIIKEMFANSKTIAVIGLSPRLERPSHYVAKYLQEAGYRIIPVNPMIDEVLGEKSYPSLLEVPEEIDMVDIFRRSNKVLPVVQEAIAVNAKYVWMQEGVINEEAAELARASGIPVVMDK